MRGQQYTSPGISEPIGRMSLCRSYIYDVGTSLGTSAALGDVQDSPVPQGAHLRSARAAGAFRHRGSLMRPGVPPSSPAASAARMRGRRHSTGAFGRREPIREREVISEAPTRPRAQDAALGIALSILNGRVEKRAREARPCV